MLPCDIYEKGDSLDMSSTLSSLMVNVTGVHSSAHRVFQITYSWNEALKVSTHSPMKVREFPQISKYVLRAASSQPAQERVSPAITIRHR